MKISWILAATLITITSCSEPNTKTSTSSQQDTNTKVDEHTSQNSLDWAGTYVGTIPCADCPGIKTTITLDKDNNFTYTAEYLERSTTVTHSGKAMWHDNGSVIHLKAADLDTKYKVGEGVLIQLDGDGKIIEATFGSSYRLTKQL